MTAAARDRIPFLLYYCSHHVHSPQFANEVDTNSTLRGGFGDSLAELDRSVGSLLKVLDDLNATNSTFVLFSSDNGPSLRNRNLGGNAGPLKCGKGTTYEGGQRVPAIVRWPGRVRPGSVQRNVASLLDVFPTILRHATNATIVAHAATSSIDLPRTAALERHDGVDLLGQSEVAPTKPSTSTTTVVLDGFDMTGLLTESGGGVGPRGGQFVYYPQIARRDRGLYAARAGRAKVHWHTQGSIQSGTTNRWVSCDVCWSEQCHNNIWVGGDVVCILHPPTWFILTLR